METNKFLWIILVLSLFLFGSTYAQIQYLKNSTSSFSQNLSKLEVTILSENWLDSTQTYGNIKAQWENSKNIWAILIDHSEIDNIENSLVRLEMHLVNKSKVLALPESALLKENISHIYEKERVSVKNIL